MAGRIRSIKPELLEDAVTAGLSHLEFRLFVSMLLMADDYGNLRATTNLILGTAFWALEETPNQVSLALSTLERKRLIRTYHVREQVYAHVSGWEKHQRVVHPGKPRVPSENEGLESLVRIVAEPLVNFSREPNESLTPDLRSPITDQEQKGERETAPASAPPANPEREAIVGELTRWPSCEVLPIPEVASMLELRWRTVQLAKGTKLAWLLTAIADAASDGVGLNAEALTRKLRTYCDNASKPRDAPGKSPEDIAAERTNRVQEQLRRQAERR